MDVRRAGDLPTRQGNPAWFTGQVLQDVIHEAPEPARMRAVTVSFAPGARTNWHTHPLGQTLLVTAGVGRAQADGGAIFELRPGDVVWFAPGERHWHGAAPGTAMTHVAIHEALDGKHVDWLEPVADADYARAL
ncbi:MAG: cupin domain-containing protein [Pseudomonadota bacterium]